MSLAVCHRGTGTHAYEAAIAALVRQMLSGLEEAKEIEKDLVDHEMELKAQGLYESRRKVAQLLSRGLIPALRLDREVVGYRRKAIKIYLALRDAGFLTIEEHEVGKSKRRVQWVGLNANWDGLIEDIQTGGESERMWASSAGIVLSLAIVRRGTTSLRPMFMGVLRADGKGGEIAYKELLLECYHGIRKKKDLDIVLERQREKIDPLRIWSSDQGGRLIVNPNAAYAVKEWRRETNRLARARGLGMTP